MSKTAVKFNTTTNSVFDDLDLLRKFCVSHGYSFNEQNLYNWKSYAYQQYSKFINGKFAKNMWEIDEANFKKSSFRKPYNRNNNYRRK